MKAQGGTRFGERELVFGTQVPEGGHLQQFCLTLKDGSHDRPARLENYMTGSRGGI
jgi:hypothetical protein